VQHHENPATRSSLPNAARATCRCQDQQLPPSGRQETWLKLKCTKSDTFPIVAFVEKLGARPRKIASLYVGRREGDRLVYAGKARSGYTEAVAREVRERLDPLIVRRSPLSIPVKKPKATWVKPVVQAEIEYGGITDDGLLREAVFKVCAMIFRWSPRRQRRRPARTAAGAAGGEAACRARISCSSSRMRSPLAKTSSLPIGAKSASARSPTWAAVR
jgi:hypothetical protein